MVTKNNTLLSGVANGTTATSGSTGASGDAVTIVGTGGTVTWTTVAGDLPSGVAEGLKCIPASGIATMATYGVTGSQGSSYHVQHIPTAPTITKMIGSHRTSTRAAIKVNLLTTGKFELRDGSNVVLYTTPTAVSFPIDVAIRMQNDVGTTAVNGKNLMGVYNANTGAFIGGMTTEFESVTCDGGQGGAMLVGQFGKVYIEVETSVFTIAGPVRYLDSYADPRPSTNAAPVVTAGAVQNITGTTANVTATGTDTDGTISSFACTLSSSSGASNPTIGAGVVVGAGTASASVTFPITALVDGQHKFNLTCTDNLGAVSVASIATINKTQLAPVLRGVTVTGMSIVGGSATALATFQANAPSTKYLQSAAPPAGGSGVDMEFQPLDPGAVAAYFFQTGRASDATTPVTMNVHLKQGATTIATISQVLALTDTIVGRNTTAPETATITDRSDLHVTSDFS